MRLRFLLITGSIVTSVFFFSCGGNDKKTTDGDKKETVKATDDGVVPVIDTANLKDEASILAAMQKVVDARMAEEKKHKEDPSYEGHYIELTNLYTAVLNASTVYSQTLGDPNKALEFTKKVTDITDKMYEK